MKKVATLIILLIISIPVFAQVRSIAGRMIDQENGNPLSGGTIQKQNVTQGIIADANGQFTIDAADGDVLIFSYIGYTSKEITVNPKLKSIEIALELNRTQLSEVVVTGALGIRRAARELGTSAQIVGNELLNQGKTVNPIFGLTSKVAGLRINMYDAANGKTDPLLQITMRGTRSINGNNQPIYVVDGVPVPNIGRINPNDIEDITVLKGANAAALYGSEGVNGAIMIITKSGSRGKGSIQFSNTTSLQNVFLAPPAQKQFGQGQNGIYSATDYESWGPAFDGSMQNIGLPLPDGTQPQALYSATGRDNRLDIFNTGVTVQNDLSFSGGDDKSTYFLSLQHVGIKGVVIGDKSNRTGARFNGSRKFGKLNTSYSINYVSFDRNTTPDGPWAATYKMPANLDLASYKNWNDLNSAASPHNFFTDQQKNPFFLMGNIRNTAKQQTINGKLELDYTFTPWFKALYRFGLYNTIEETRITTGKFEAAGARNVNGSVSDGSNNFQRLNNDLILNFHKDFGRFSTRLLLGQNVRMDDTKTISVGASNLVFSELFNPESRIGDSISLNGHLW
jgi:TonB-dependent SusC/RagA subfamily outer membrane receptor